jgi:homoserine dehydrogenase
MKQRQGIVGTGKTLSATEVISDMESDVVVELTPANSVTAEPGLSHIRSALAAGRNVVSASKMPLALHFGELTSTARSRHVLLKYGACVGSGLPVLEFGEICVTAESILKIEGVLNATTNFVLSGMEATGNGFTEALQQARRLGYTEANAQLDLEGIDAAAKLVVLVNHLLGTKLVLKDVRPVEGISELTGARIKKAWKRERRIRSLATYDKKAQVRIVELDKGNALCVSGAWNAVKFQCAESGERMVMGPAAGGSTAARAVLRDLVSLARSHQG